MPPTKPPLSTVLPPLILGTATFNTQYNPDPFAIPTTAIIARSLALGIRAFDTSPYYGPSEQLLGTALSSLPPTTYPRSSYHILTKVGRTGPSSFDYSPAWVRTSVARSLRRLQTPYLDVVYCHDVEFVSATEVLAAVTELRRLRDSEHTLRYVGISGYPLPVLCALAHLVLQRTGEPLDAVMSYAHYSLQNTLLAHAPLRRLHAARVDVVPNASLLGMGLLRRCGIPVGGQGDWHPAPDALREKVAQASAYCDGLGDRIEKVAVRWAVENWLAVGAAVGSSGGMAAAVPADGESQKADGGAVVPSPQGKRLGVSVLGVSSVEELEECMAVWRSVLDTVDKGELRSKASGNGEDERKWGLKRKEEVRRRAERIREILGPWYDYAWPSPGEGYVNQRENENK